MRRAIEGAALESNQRYLETFIEAHSFCPFSRGGRAQERRRASSTTRITRATPRCSTCSCTSRAIPTSRSCR
ncbi:MAG: hypothetical protein M5U28_56595 [Sandaracinaceae bacterium]|nr:hypothetical protein [Sandaracinaceae bacterium]